MTNSDALWLLTGGLALLLAGQLLLAVNDPFLAALWGIGFLLFGGISAVVGGGVLLKIWR